LGKKERGREGLGEWTWNPIIVQDRNPWKNNSRFLKGEGEERRDRDPLWSQFRKQRGVAEGGGVGHMA